MRKLISIIVIISCILLVQSQLSENTSAQTDEQPNDFASHFRMLDERLRDGDLTQFHMSLSHPFADGTEAITIGPRQEWNLDEIGTDYICVEQVAGAAVVKLCIPLSEISISYVDN